jgi:hypothetical protein
MPAPQAGGGMGSNGTRGESGYIEYIINELNTILINIEIYWQNFSPGKC